MRNIKSTFSRTGHMCFLIDFLKICLFLILTPVPHTNTHHKASEDLKYCTQIARTTFTIFWWWFCQFFNLAADVFKISWNSVSLTLKCTTFPSRFLCVHLNTTSFQVKSSQVKSALLSILPHVQYIHTENWNCVTLRPLVHTVNIKHWQ